MVNDGGDTDEVEPQVGRIIPTVCHSNLFFCSMHDRVNAAADLTQNLVTQLQVCRVELYLLILLSIFKLVAEVLVYVLLPLKFWFTCLHTFQV